jgi:PEP-CTERM motif
MRRAAIGAAVVLGTAMPASAASFTLLDGNSRIGLDDRNGITTWFVDGGRDNVFLSNLYYRVGDSGPEQNLLGGLGVPAASQAAANALELTFTGPGITAVLSYELRGWADGSGRSRLTRSLAFTNTSDSPLDLHLFDYSDFDIKFFQPAQRDQSVATSTGRIITTSADQPYRIVTRVEAAPDHFQIADFFTMYTRFFVDLDGPTQLTDSPGIGQPFPVPAGDNAFAFQWDRLLGAGETFRIAHVSDFMPIAEPASLALFGLGLAGLGALHRRRKA